MSREAYTPNFSPSTGPNNAGAGASSGTAGQTAAGGSGGGDAFSNFNTTTTNTFEDTSRAVQYLCGDCDSKVTLKRGDPIRCKECGYRVLYKERTNR